jgi:hypothetical protein
MKLYQMNSKEVVSLNLEASQLFKDLCAIYKLTWVEVLKNMSTLRIQLKNETSLS